MEHTIVCRKCGATIPAGTLLYHERAEHPPVVAAAAKAKTCYRAKCVEVYGPEGHVVGLEGPHAY